MNELQTVSDAQLVVTTPDIHAEYKLLRTGVICGVSAHLMWGFLPLYIKLVSNVPPLQILAHRIAWSLLFVALVIILRGGWQELAVVLRDRRAMLMLCASTTMLSANWFVFIYAVNSGHTVEASLGYFINPLLSVLLGVTFLGERMRRWQGVGLMLATAGVVYLTWSHGSIPWIALSLAITFGSYGLLRKTVRAGSLSGLTIETALLFIPAVLTIGI
ncbi:MAG TPA: EamA family transporter RarD [Tepidisphaeraceae bacterium]|nr:EamA family transporter RarD [Tepidisphaeraceae bacterium]